MNTRKQATPALSLQTNSTTSSPRGSSSLDESEADEDGNVNMADYMPSRALTVSIPRGYVQGPYCARRPNLSEILANTAAPPWTLSAFMAYLSHNHCLETLEFTMDASRYRKHYNKMTSRTLPGQAICPVSDECNYVKMLWQRLLNAYIAPNGPREVNLPSDVRDSLLSLSNSYIPPHPSTLDPAVSKIYELMEESVLVPFLNSLCLQSVHADSSYGTSDDFLQSHTGSYDDRALYRYQTTTITPPSSVPHSGYQRASAPSSLTNSYSRSLGSHGAHTRFASGPPRLTPSSCGSGVSVVGSGSDFLTDDSGSASSPSALSEPMTPPTTPPMSDYGGSGRGTPSPRASRGDHGIGIAGATANQWKRVSSKLGWKKKGGSEVPEQEYDGRTF